MICPSCGTGSDVRVLETRHSKVGIRRRRACVCGHKFTTIEMVVPDFFDVRGELRLVPMSELEAIRASIDRLTLADAPGVVEADLVGEKIEKVPVIER